MPATAVAVAAYQTSVAWGMTVTAMWWTATPTASHTPLPTWTPVPPTATATHTPVAIAELSDAKHNVDEPQVVTQPDNSQVGSAGTAFLLFLAGVAVVGIPVGVWMLQRYTAQDNGAPLPDPMRPTLLRRYGETQWVDAVRQDLLIAKSVSPRQASALIDAWGDVDSGAGQVTWNHITSFWRDVVIATLTERGMLRGDVQPAARAIAAPDRVIYLLDMANLGGVRYEQWLDGRFIEQMRAASGGCRVVVTGEGGIAVQIGVMPEPVVEAAPEPEHEPLPTLAPLDLSTRPRPAYSVGIGIGHSGPIWAPLESLGHIMVSGSTGSGKSYFLRSLAYQFITLPRSQKVALYLADRAGNVFTPLDAYKVPQLATPVAKTPEAVVEMLNAAIVEMQRREQLFDAEFNHFPDKLSEYNAIEGVKPLPRIIVIVDEVTVLVAETGGEKGGVHQALLTLAAQGRKYGVTLVVAGQDFKASTFNTALTHQLLTRVAFKAGSAHESRVVIEEEGAENLRGAGHGLLRHGGRLIEFQGFFVEKTELITCCKAIGTEPEPGPKLEDWQIKLVLYAIEQLDGAFTIRKLANAFDDIGEYQVRKLAEEWEAASFLTREPYRAFEGGPEIERRVVTPRLTALARDH